MEFSTTRASSYLPTTKSTGSEGPSQNIVIPTPKELPIQLSPLKQWNVVDPILFPNRNLNAKEVDIRSKIFAKFSAFRVIDKLSFDAMLFAIMVKLSEIAFEENTPARIRNALSQIGKSGIGLRYFDKYLGVEYVQDQYIIYQFFSQFNSGTEADRMIFDYQSELNKEELQKAIVILFKSGIKKYLDHITSEEKIREGFLNIVNDLTDPSLDYRRIELYTSCICQILSIKICILLMDAKGPGRHHEITGRAERYDFPTPIQLITRGGKIFIGEYPSFASFDRIVEVGDWYRGITMEPQSVPEERKEFNIGEEIKSGEMRINNIDNINDRNNRNNMNMNIPTPNRLESVQSYPTTEPNSLREDAGTSGFPLPEESKNTTLATSNDYPLNVRRSEGSLTRPISAIFRRPGEGIPYNIQADIANISQQPLINNSNNLSRTHIAPNNTPTTILTQVCPSCRKQVSNVITCINQHLICSSCLRNNYGCPICKSM